MVYRDYLKKQIDELGRVLGKLLADLISLKTQGKTEQGIEIVNQTLKTELDLDLSEILSLSEEEIIEKLEKMTPDYKLIGVYADIIYEMLDDLNYEKAKKADLLKKILALYEHVEKKSSTFSFENHTKIELIKKELQ
ncbi:MAG: hypothetical protein HOO91_01510 [Bacteroidales bacterium]|nr:hypothetical protein [Bacteroidales bacterium]